MSTEFLRINDGDLIPLHTVKRISEITPKERSSLAALSEHVDAALYGTRIDFAGGSKKCYAQQSISDFRIQGIRLVEFKQGAFVVAEHILKARNLTDRDRESFEERTGRPLDEAFVSQIELKSGKVLATLDAAQIMKAINGPLRSAVSSAASPAQAPDAPPSSVEAAPEA